MQEVTKSAGKGVTFKNGVPFQLVLTFKTIACLPDGEELTTAIVREWYHKLFGVTISTSSVSRNTTDLNQLGFIERVVNPFGSRKFSWIKLSAQGRRLQKLFMGTTGDWKDAPRLTVDRNIKTARSTKGVA